jgi:hypothetical protein
MLLEDRNESLILPMGFLNSLLGVVTLQAYLVD